MADTRDWPTETVLSIVTGRLVADFSTVHEMLEWMAGEPVWTHQLPRVCREAAPLILAEHPALQSAVAEAEQVTKENWPDWRKAWLARYGEMLAVSPIPTGSHQSIGPLSELASMMTARGTN